MSTQPVDGGSGDFILRQDRRTVLFLDIARSVTLIERDGMSVIERWIALSQTVSTRIGPEHGGRLVKRTGDGLLLEFENPLDAVRAGLETLALTEAQEAEFDVARRIRLRLGAVTCDVVRGPGDLYGHGVNLAARLMQRASPGEFLISAETRDGVTDGIDAEIEDYGELELRNMSRPVRAYRVGPQRRDLALPGLSTGRLQPRIAVLPPTPRLADRDSAFIGEILAEELNGVLARFSEQFGVISRLSASSLNNRGMSAREIGERLGAEYLVSGRYDAHGGAIRLSLELTHARSEEAVDAVLESFDQGELASPDRAAITRVASQICRSLMQCEIARARRAPLSSLHSYTMMLAAVSMYHRLSLPDFELAQRLLEGLVEREPDRAAPYAWLGSWHVMRAQQGWSVDVQQDAQLASRLIEDALNLEPDCVTALVARGSVAANLQKRLDLAEQAYMDALEINPSEASAWVRRAALNAVQGRGVEAVAHAEKAIALSPIDPHRYLYDSLAASAYLALGEDSTALAYAEESMRANRRHASTLRVKAVAEWRLGMEEQARGTVRELLKIEPGLTCARYIAASPAPDSPMVREVAKTLRKAGLAA